MKVYDEIIRNINSLLDGREFRELKRSANLAAPEGNKNELILAREAAYEFGEGTLPSLNLSVFTNDSELISKDRILLYGRDLTELSGNSPFARLTLILADNIGNDGEQGAYSIIKNIEMKKYELSPSGYMLRVSALSNRELVRVGTEAVERGLSFEHIGNLYINKYKENKHVKAVVIIFITEPDAPYKALDKLASSAVNITRALNHVLADLELDCHCCEWKPVCDEVDGMKEMHSKIAKH